MTTTADNSPGQLEFFCDGWHLSSLPHVPVQPLQHLSCIALVMALITGLIVPPSPLSCRETLDGIELVLVHLSLLKLVHWKLHHLLPVLAE